MTQCENSGQVNLLPFLGRPVKSGFLWLNCAAPIKAYIAF
jgi:hypothetical protein